MFLKKGLEPFMIIKNYCQESDYHLYYDVCTYLCNGLTVYSRLATSGRIFTVDKQKMGTRMCISSYTCWSLGKSHLKKFLISSFVLSKFLGISESVWQSTGNMVVKIIFMTKLFRSSSNLPSQPFPPLFCFHTF